MSNVSDSGQTIERAVSEARTTLGDANRHTARMVRLCPGWIDYADSDLLRALKRQLRSYNAHTKRWRP